MKSMKTVLMMLMVLSLSVMGSVAAFAQENTTQTPRINHRQREQQKRIRQGARSGELTRGETRTLEREQRDIRQDKREAKADGVVTSAERREITRDQNQANRDIRRLKHNNRKRR